MKVAHKPPQLRLLLQDPEKWELSAMDINEQFVTGAARLLGVEFVTVSPDGKRVLLRAPKGKVFGVEQSMPILACRNVGDWKEILSLILSVRPR